MYVSGKDLSKSYFEIVMFQKCGMYLFLSCNFANICFYILLH